MKLNDNTSASSRELRDNLNLEIVSAACPVTWVVETMGRLFDYATGNAPLPKSGSFAERVHDLHREIEDRARVFDNMKKFVSACVRNAANDPETEELFDRIFLVGGTQHRYKAKDNAELMVEATAQGIEPAAFAAACPAMTLTRFAELMDLSKQAAFEAYGHLFEETEVAGTVRRAYE